MLKRILNQYGVIKDKAIQLERFIDIYIKKNQNINLTKISGQEDFINRHILDAVMADRFFNISERMMVADIGTGGGLPGLVLAILHPEAEFVLIDSVQKKIRCVEEFANELGLKNVKGIADRLEVIGRGKYREGFDLVVSRALAPLGVLLELGLPLVKAGGRFAAMKGPGYLEEISEAGNAMNVLKIGIPRAERYEFPNDFGKRYVLIFDKRKPTSWHYPRRVGVPGKRPL